MFQIHRDQLEYIEAVLCTKMSTQPTSLYYGGYLGEVFPTSSTAGIVIIASSITYERPFMYDGEYNGFMDFMTANPAVKIFDRLIERTR